MRGGGGRCRGGDQERGAGGSSQKNSGQLTSYHFIPPVLTTGASLLNPALPSQATKDGSAGIDG
jgi:hypothetical protein